MASAAFLYTGKGLSALCILFSAGPALFDLGALLKGRRKQISGKTILEAC